MNKEKTLRKLEQFLEEIKESFGIEFVEVVRCAKCKHYNERAFLCYKSGTFKVIEPDNYCSHGERRDGE